MRTNNASLFLLLVTIYNAKLSVMLNRTLPSHHCPKGKQGSPPNHISTPPWELKWRVVNVQGHVVEPFTHGIYSINVLTGLWIMHTQWFWPFFLAKETNLSELFGAQWQIHSLYGKSDWSEWWTTAFWDENRKHIFSSSVGKLSLWIHTEWRLCHGSFSLI